VDHAGDGRSLLADALAAIDCELDEAIKCHSHAIVIGRVKAIWIGERRGAGILARSLWKFGSGDADSLHASVEVRQPGHCQFIGLQLRQSSGSTLTIEAP
jgi:flavin reductase (DIM6/NTAB) family NADH-FMN oxidoreductase RutF